ncbi:16S rRNA (guanine(966)-N(2))-methyltransferase RsmD [Pelagibacteraceae bacterium]|nr:16S rRNA (guanine(966)-N(2))-methyltransferase RsmD [Pelagibacteraceae bacterium]
MRVIGGYLKGKKILFPKSKKTRPLRDFVKESMFNSIVHSNKINIKIKNAKILDLYSGIGSFGIECLSREAKRVTFVENDQEAISILSTNLKTLDIEEKIYLIPKKIEFFLNDNNEKFDIIFLDPPFAENNFIEELKLIKAREIYNKNHLIIIHRESKTKESFEGILKVLFEKKYGRSKIIFSTF